MFGVIWFVTWYLVISGESMGFCQFWIIFCHSSQQLCISVYLEFHIARRHGHVFRMALHNEGDWRMETWQRARRASCQVSIRQSPSCVMPFWTHAKCLLAFISYLPVWIKAKYTFIKTVYSPRFYGGPYLQAKHADVCSGVLFWTACTRRPHVLSLPSSSGCEKSDSWRQARSVKTAKKSHERYLNVVMWHWIVYKWRRSNKMLSFRRTFFNLLDFTVSLSYRDWHFKTPWSHSSNQPGGTYSGTGFLVAHQLYIGNVMRKYKIGKSSPHQPCENTCHSNVLELSLLWMARALACF